MHHLTIYAAGACTPELKSAELPRAKDLHGYAAVGITIVAPPMWAQLNLN